MDKQKAIELLRSGKVTRVANLGIVSSRTKAKEHPAEGEPAIKGAIRGLEAAKSVKVKQVTDGWEVTVDGDPYLFMESRRRLTRGALTLSEGILPVAEVGKFGKSYTRMQVQRFYENQRNIGLSIRDACRGTEFALNIKDIQVDSSGRTVVFFTESVEVVNPVTVQALVDKVNALIDKAREQAIRADVAKARAQGKPLYDWAKDLPDDKVVQDLIDVNYPNFHLVVKPRKKYIAIDTKGGSGKFLVDTSTGLVHDIKGYGVIHPRNFGSLSQLTADPKKLARVSVGPYNIDLIRLMQ